MSHELMLKILYLKCKGKKPILFKDACSLAMERSFMSFQ